MNAAEIEKKIEEFFGQNYELLRYEAGHDVTQDVKELAKQQVLAYWKKLQHIAESVTETEVRLALPDQTSPGKRKFTIEGVVDIVREDEKTYMYDIKTHDLDYIRNNIGLYENQLNIYAHIWKGLRGNALDHSSIISTALPPDVKDAFRKKDDAKMKEALLKWEPIHEIELDDKRIDELIKDFGKIVDCIEDHEFAPPTVTKLKAKAGGKNSRENFATRVCRNCDARFSCTAYRQYAAGTQGKTLYNFRQFWIDAEAPQEQEDFLTSSIDADEIDRAMGIADELE
ncbi:MAG TPA: PD-(D/E)XK nuclease family protein [Cytophaga sp.]|jgi:hypothetical protein|nr:PD-(D/E)XK nuclease family protein [Cytophaga sp.]